MSTPLVILGPTASGKSDVAMALASALTGVEIVAVDAMQVYRGMDIGTAKPTRRDQAAVAHHCIDLVDPDHDFAVAEHVQAATVALADIERRGCRPVLVAGTGLYLRALTDPMELPGTWPEVRARLEARAAALPVEHLYSELVAVDPDAAGKVEPGNLRRIVRALEVCEGSGRRFSSFGPGLDSYAPTRFVQVGLRWTRAALAERIEKRVQAMIAAGLCAEVVAVLERWPEMSRTARQALGYKELIAHLDGVVSFDEAVEQIIVRTRQYAVRQDRWYRRDPRIQWIDIHTDPVAEAVPVISGLAVVSRASDS
ncbi:MAG: miaA [Acidimicrobiaceae bacterium]|nr:MAG: miaA [Acidimicrobiaceae bacterium]